MKVLPKETIEELRRSCAGGAIADAMEELLHRRWQVEDLQRRCDESLARARKAEGQAPPVLRVARAGNPAAMPSRAHPSDAGLDLYAAHGDSIELPPRCRATIGTGWSFEIPERHVGLVLPRSGLAKNHGVVAAVGVIDAGYRGEVGITLMNHGLAPHLVERSDRIAQLVVVPIALAQPVEVPALSAAERGTEGFGSTGA